MKDYDALLERAYANMPSLEEGEGERFEMPVFDFFVEGNKTIIKNFKTVCDRIRRSPQMLAKFLSKELAVPVEIVGDRLILQRRIVKEVLDKKLEEFVKRYVICSQCKRPDTRIEEVAHRLKNLVCEACGARTALR